MDPRQIMLNRIDELVAKGDKMIINVWGSEDGLQNGFCYSVGLTSLGLPELFISGNADPRIQCALIESVAAMYQEKGVSLGIHEGLLANGLRMELVEVDCADHKIRNEYIILAMDYYQGHAIPGCIRLVQLRWPDTQGRLPDEPGYDMADKQDLLPSSAQTKSMQFH
ncbi:DUF4262 domain-containing protein [Aeromonas veronii]|nr:DUF4262 domain-containing protein [Aeromonas veronii]